MSKSQMAKMGYNAAEEMFNISQNESVKLHFKIKRKDQYLLKYSILFHIIILSEE